MTGLTPPTRLNGRVLVVGASDASGSTGIQAAIKSISALGAFASAAVTAVVTDDTATSHEVPSLAVAAQLRMVLADIGADVLVIGGLASAGTIEAVADVMDGEARGIPVVLDLTDGTETPLLPLARIVVAASTATDLGTQKNAAAALARTAGAALVTSAAHGDVLADGTTLSVFPPRRGTDRPVRGAGMTLAAAGFVGLQAWDATLSEVLRSVPQVVGGFGFGLVIAPLGAAVLQGVPEGGRATASAWLTLSRVTGMLVGTAVLTSTGLGRFYARASQAEFNSPDFERLIAEAQVTTFREVFIAQLPKVIERETAAHPVTDFSRAWQTMRQRMQPIQHPTHITRT